MTSEDSSKRSADDLVSDRKDGQGRRYFLTFFPALLAAAIGFLMFGRFLTSSLKRPQTVHIPLQDLDRNELTIRDGVVIIPGKDGYEIFSDRCPHLGCRLHYHQDRQRFSCPCHGSEFTEHGVFITGPAGRDMQILKAEKISGELIVHLDGE